MSHTGDRVSREKRIEKDERRPKMIVYEPSQVIADEETILRATSIARFSSNNITDPYVEKQTGRKIRMLKSKLRYLSIRS